MKKTMLLFFISLFICQVFPDTKWEGEWYRNSLNSSADITIKNIEQNSFFFEIDAFSGANTGHLEGKAFISGTTATAPLKDEDMEIISEIFFKHNGTSIEIKTINCEYHAGNGVTFDGIYTNAQTSETITAYEHMIAILENEKLVKSIQTITDEHFTYIASCMHILIDGLSADNFPAKVIIGCVQGICPYMQAIIMVTPNNTFYIACIDDNTIYYFTSDPSYKKVLPKTIAEWIKEYPDVKIKYH